MVSLRMTTLPQLVRLMLAGRMKSFSCEVKASEERLFSIALPNEVHLFAWKMRRRSICASPNVRADKEPLEMMPSESAAGIAEELIVPVAHGLPPQVAEFTSRSCAAPHAMPVQVRPVMSARAPP